MLTGIGGRQAAVLLLACAALVVAFLALGGPLSDGGGTVEASETDAALDQAAADESETPSSGEADADGGDSGTVDETADGNPAAASAKDAAPALAVKTGEQLTTTTAPTAATTVMPDEPDDGDASTDQAETTLPPATEAPTATEPAPTGDKPVIHLTFDDGPSELTPRVLDLIEQYDGRATFFVMGSAVEDHPEIAREIVDRGHAIANHSYDHMDWRQAGAREDAIRTQEIIQSTTGVTPSCARPPFGAQDENLLSILSSLGMDSWRWDLSAEDHTVARYHVEETLNTIDEVPNIRGAEGKIFLQHDSDLQVSPTIDGLEAWLAKNGDRYEFKAIDGCLDYQ